MRGGGGVRIKREFRGGGEGHIRLHKHLAIFIHDITHFNDATNSGLSHEQSHISLMKIDTFREENTLSEV